MKKVSHLILLVLLLTLFSCGKGSKTPTHLPFKESSSDNWGMISLKGEKLFADEFSETPTAVFNGRFFVKNNNGYWEMYTADKKPKQIGDEYEQACVFTADVTPVLKKGGKVIEIIDTDGKTRFVFEKVGNKKVSMMFGYSDGIALFVLEDESVGAVDTKGNVVIEPKYALLTPAFQGRLLGVDKKYKNSEKPSVDILTTKGEKLFSVNTAKYTPCDVFIYDDLLSISNEKGCGLMNMKGEIVLNINDKIRNITEINNGKFIFYDGNKWGLKDLDGNTLIRAKYNYMYFANDGKSLAVQDDNSNCFLIDFNDEKLSSNTFESFYRAFNTTLNIVKTGSDSYSFIDSKGEFIKKTPEIYDFATKIADEYIKVTITKPNEIIVENGDTLSYDYSDWDPDSIPDDIY